MLGLSHVPVMQKKKKTDYVGDFLFRSEDYVLKKDFSSKMYTKVNYSHCLF